MEVAGTTAAVFLHAPAAAPPIRVSVKGVRIALLTSGDGLAPAAPQQLIIIVNRPSVSKADDSPCMFKLCVHQNSLHLAFSSYYTYYQSTAKIFPRVTNWYA
jgi:hypothetical protein